MPVHIARAETRRECHRVAKQWLPNSAEVESSKFNTDKLRSDVNHSHLRQSKTVSFRARISCFFKTRIFFSTIELLCEKFGYHHRGCFISVHMVARCMSMFFLRPSINKPETPQ